MTAPEPPTEDVPPDVLEAFKLALRPENARALTFDEAREFLSSREVTAEEARQFGDPLLEGTRVPAPADSSWRPAASPQGKRGRPRTRPPVSRWRNAYVTLVKRPKLRARAVTMRRAYGGMLRREIDSHVDTLCALGIPPRFWSALLSHGVERMVLNPSWLRRLARAIGVAETSSVRRLLSESSLPPLGVRVGEKRVRQLLHERSNNFKK